MISSNCSGGLEADALLGGDLLEMERFAECSAEILPHIGRDPLALLERKLRIGDRQIAKRPFLPVKTRGDETPGEARSPRHGLERQRRRGRLGGPKREILQAVAQVLGGGHRLARGRRAAKAADCDGRRASVKRGAAFGSCRRLTGFLRRGRGYMRPSGGGALE